MAGRSNSFIGICVTGLMCLLAGHAEAASKPKPIPIPKLRPSTDTAALQPAMWKIVNGKSTAYLLGSLHVLPADFNWRTPAMEKAIAAADVFIFETNMDFATAEFHYFMDQQGYLPRGETLPKKLSTEARERYLTLIKDLKLDQNRVDYLRPGLAVFLLEQAHARSQIGYVPGVDANLLRQAKQDGKQVGYLESLQSQFEVLAAIGGGSEMALLEKSLLNTKDETSKYPGMVAAWSEGDLAKLMTFNDEDDKQNALLLDNRNKAWLPKIESLLASPRTYLITVGAAHLAGKNSVIDLLCQKHWKMERVQTGSSPPPPACPA